VRKILAAIILALVMFGLGVSAGTGVQLNGLIGASEHEADEGYFALSQDTMLMVKPGSATHQWLRSHIGQRVVLTVEPDASSE
jgi:hypothetical protein